METDTLTVGTTRINRERCWHRLSSVFLGALDIIESAYIETERTHKDCAAALADLHQPLAEASAFFCDLMERKALTDEYIKHNLYYKKDKTFLPREARFRNAADSLLEASNYISEQFKLDKIPLQDRGNVQKYLESTKKVIGALDRLRSLESSLGT